MDAKGAVSGDEKWNYVRGDQFQISDKKSEESRKRAPF